MSPVDPLGPVFISYRPSDGTPYAVALAWALRAAGVPVWHDRTDLPPGDTTNRLKEALAGGLSGAVLLVTPEVDKSTVVPKIELPALLRLEEDPAFTLSIASTVYRSDDPTELDFSAPDRLLGPMPKKLAQLLIEPATTAEDRARIARWQARRRVEALRPVAEANGGRLTMDVQSRVPPFAARQDAELVLRLQPPEQGHRRPHPDGLADLRRFLADLPQLLALAGARHLRIRGGAHLSVAFAIGAAVPTTLLGLVDVIDTNGADVWTAGSGIPSSGDPLVTGTAETRTSGADAVLVYLDLVPALNDRPYRDLLAANLPDLAASIHLRPTRDGFLNPADAQRIVDDADLTIRRLAGEHGTNIVHLLLRTPYPIALLLGRRLNTLRVHLYELEDGPEEDGTPAPQRYVPSMIVRSGVGGSPIEQVFLPDGSATRTGAA